MNPPRPDRNAFSHTFVAGGTTSSRRRNAALEMIESVTSGGSVKVGRRTIAAGPYVQALFLKRVASSEPLVVSPSV
jgi:hypothetical protein